MQTTAEKLFYRSNHRQPSTPRSNTTTAMLNVVSKKRKKNFFWTQAGWIVFSHQIWRVAYGDKLSLTTLVSDWR